MDNHSQFREIFERLKAILSPYTDEMTCVTDEPGDFYLDTQHIMKNKKPLFFGAVHIRKNYVSYHLMPVYVFPELLETVSPQLKKRMQGKSCFNFKVLDSELFEDLKRLTEAGYKQYQAAGYVGVQS